MEIVSALALMDSVSRQTSEPPIYLCYNSYYMYMHVYIFIVIYTLALATWRNLKQFTKAQTILLSCRRLAPLVVVLLVVVGSAWAFAPWPLL